MLVLSHCGRMLLRLCFMISGAAALITLQQPPVVTATLGHDVVLPCELQDSHDEKTLNTPVLYWVADGRHQLLAPDGKYAGRVESLNQTSPNRSIVLKDVRWSDGGIYDCKLSIRTDIRGSFRLKGNGTMLIIYDAMTFNLTNHNDSLLRCEVKVSQDLGFSLSVVKDRCVLQSLDSAGKRSINRTVTALSWTVPLRGKGKYECRLQLGEDLVTTRTFHSELTAAGEDEKNATCSPDMLNVKQYPEPWILYTSLLLVPILVLLVLCAAMLMQRGSSSGPELFNSAE